MKLVSIKIITLYTSSYDNHITFLGLVHEGGKTYGVYAVSITRVYMSGKEENWHVYKRYSDFYDLYQRVKDKVKLLTNYYYKFIII